MDIERARRALRWGAGGVFLVALIAIAMGFLGFHVGYGYCQEAMRRDLVKKGHGHWVILDDTGRTDFRLDDPGKGK